MSVVVITPPEPFVELDTAKAHLRVETAADDDLIEAYIAAACGHIDGPGGWLDRAIAEQTLELRTCSPWGTRCDRLSLPYPPVIAVASVVYDDLDSAEQTFDPAGYRVTSLGEIEVLSGIPWPSTRLGSDNLRIRYSAGCATIPPAITAAVLLMVGDLYANRETSGVGTLSEIPMSTTVKALLAPWRVWNV